MDCRTICPTNIHCDRLPHVATNRHWAVGRYICLYLWLYIGLMVQTNRLMQFFPHRNKEPGKTVTVLGAGYLHYVNRKTSSLPSVTIFRSKISIICTGTKGEDETILQDNFLKTTTGRCSAGRQGRQPPPYYTHPHRFRFPDERIC